MKFRLEPVKQKFIYDYDEDAYHIKDTGYYNSELMETDHIVSKNHNVLVSESWATNNSSYPDKVFAEKLYQIVKDRETKQINSNFHIPGLNGLIPCTIEKIHYKGKVWCVEVESGAFVARRNGKIFITGNSGFPKSLNIGKAVDKLQRGNRAVDLINALLEEGHTLKELGDKAGIPSLESSYRDWTTGGHKPEERSWERMLKGLGFSEKDGLNIIEKRTVKLGGIS